MRKRYWVTRKAIEGLWKRAIIHESNDCGSLKATAVTVEITGSQAKDMMRPGARLCKRCGSMT